MTWVFLLFFFQITMEAMKSDVDEIALQGIEFWSSVCDEEVDLAIELSEVSCPILVCYPGWIFLILEATSKKL